MSKTLDGAFDRLKAVDVFHSEVIGKFVEFTDDGCRMQVEVGILAFGGDAEYRKAREEAFAAELVKRWNAGAHT